MSTYGGAPYGGSTTSEAVVIEPGIAPFAQVQAPTVTTDQTISPGVTPFTLVQTPSVDLEVAPDQVAFAAPQSPSLQTTVRMDAAVGFAAPQAPEVDQAITAGQVSFAAVQAPAVVEADTIAPGAIPFAGMQAPQVDQTISAGQVGFVTPLQPGVQITLDAPTVSFAAVRDPTVSTTDFIQPDVTPFASVQGPALVADQFIVLEAPVPAFEAQTPVVDAGSERITVYVGGEPVIAIPRVYVNGEFKQASVKVYRDGAFV